MLIQKLIDLYMMPRETEFMKLVDNSENISKSRLPMVNGIHHEINRLLKDKAYEFYSFEKSALIIAASMGRSDPDGFDAITNLLLQKPRKVFIECDWNERLVLYEKHHKSYDRSNEEVDIANPVRIAADIDIKGNGKAKIRVWWTFSKQTMRDVGTISEFKSIGFNKAEAKFITKTITVECATYSIDVDASSNNALTKEEFIESIQNGGEETKFVLEAQHFLRTKNFVIDKSKPHKLNDYAYKLYRNSLVQELDLNRELALSKNLSAPKNMTEKERLGVIESSRRDLDGEFFAAICLLAALEVPEKTLSNYQPTVQKLGASSSKKPVFSKETIERRKGLPNVSVVTLELDNGVMEAVERDNYETAMGEGGSSGKRSSPVRHLVRGHIVRRNDKLIFRKPHFRGTLDKEFVINKVR